jgi:hypothetical protein
LECLIASQNQIWGKIFCHLNIRIVKFIQKTEKNRYEFSACIRILLCDSLEREKINVNLLRIYEFHHVIKRQKILKNEHLVKRHCMLRILLKTFPQKTQKMSTTPEFHREGHVTAQ